MVVVGRITKASHTLLRAELTSPEGGRSLCVSDVVYIGEGKLRGEIAEFDGRAFWIIPYADAAGVFGDDKVYSSFLPQEAQLGPGLVGGVFDALLSPLSREKKKSGDDSGFSGRGKIRHFDARMKFGDKVRAGDVYGYVREDGGFLHKIKAAPGVEGTVIELRSGYFRPTDRVGKIKRPDGNIEDIKLYTNWPCGVLRPHSGKTEPRAKMFTGSRAVDGKFPVLHGFSVCVRGGDFLRGAPVYTSADICVYAGCGMRDADLKNLTESLEEVSSKTVLIASRAGESFLMHEAAVQSGVTVAEYFRDMGHSVLLVIDSLDSFADSLQIKTDFLSGLSRAENAEEPEVYSVSVLKEVREILLRAGNVRVRAGEGQDDRQSAALTVFAGLNTVKSAKSDRLLDAMTEFCDVYLNFGNGGSEAALDKSASFTRHVLTRAKRQAGGPEQPADSGEPAVKAAQASGKTEPVSFDAAQKPAETEQVPGQVPAEAGQVPAEAGQVPAEAGQVPAEAGQVPVEAGQVPVEAGQTLAQREKVSLETEADEKTAPEPQMNAQNSSVGPDKQDPPQEARVTDAYPENPANKES